MHNAVEQDRLEIVRFLIEAGAKFDQPTQESGITPLHRAADYGLIESVRLLVNAGADLHRRNDDGKTALHLAIENNHQHSP